MVLAILSLTEPLFYQDYYCFVLWPTLPGEFLFFLKQSNPFGTFYQVCNLFLKIGTTLVVKCAPTCYIEIMVACSKAFKTSGGDEGHFLLTIE